MGNFNKRGEYPSRGRSFGDRGRSRGGFQSRGRASFGGDRQMFKSVCSNCGKDCEVPFRPTSGKPVYCSDCFEKMGGRGQDSPRQERPERSDFRVPAPSFDQNKVQFDALNVKLDKILRLLEPKVTSEVSTPVKKEIKTPKVKKESK